MRGKKEITHYEKAADEIISAAKELVDFRETSFRKLAWRKSKKIIVKMLKTNFTAKKSKWI